MGLPLSHWLPLFFSLQGTANRNPFPQEARRGEVERACSTLIVWFLREPLLQTDAHLYQVPGDSCALSPDYANDSMRQSVQIIQPFSLIRAPAMTVQQ